MTRPFDVELAFATTDADYVVHLTSHELVLRTIGVVDLGGEVSYGTLYMRDGRSFTVFPSPSILLGAGPQIWRYSYEQELRLGYGDPRRFAGGAIDIEGSFLIGGGWNSSGVHYAIAGTDIGTSIEIGYSIVPGLYPTNTALDNFVALLDTNTTYTIDSRRTLVGGEYLTTLTVAPQGQVNRAVIREYSDVQGNTIRREYFDASNRRVMSEYFLPDVIVNGAVVSGGRQLNVFDTTGAVSYAATIDTSGAYTPQVVSQTALDGLPAIWQTMASTTNPGLGDNIIVVDANGRPVFNTISDGVGGIADGTPLADLALFNVSAASFGVIDDVDLFANLDWNSATYATSTPTGVPGISVTSAGGEFENFFTNTPDGIWIQEGQLIGNGASGGHCGV